ncbi:ChbG/HpnK family deacetylase [Microlunatus sp. Y2014]|uniref:ChbG/HpnK family deacetylase n=1 Tax=Microlunatus sp. Y2014 TaxID=3418488 RepID=UPI003DA70C14
MSRRVVITADDLGREQQTTAVITDLLADALITATTIIPVSPHSFEAAAAMRELGVVPRLHVTLTSEGGLPGWRPLTSGRSLVDEVGLLPSDPFLLGARGEPTDVLAELEAQLGWQRDQGMAPVAVDSHAGTLYGLHGRSFLAEALHWCASYGFAFRLPRDPAPYLGGPVPTELAGPHRQALELADRLGVALPETIVTNRRSASDLGSYEALRDAYLIMLAELPDGISEVFLHPSSADAVRGPNGILRVWEARLLRDPVWHDTLDREGIQRVEGWWP